MRGTAPALPSETPLGPSTGFSVPIRTPLPLPEAGPWRGLPSAEGRRGLAGRGVAPSPDLPLTCAGHTCHRVSQPPQLPKVSRTPPHPRSSPPTAARRRPSQPPAPAPRRPLPGSGGRPGGALTGEPGPPQRRPPLARALGAPRPPGACEGAGRPPAQRAPGSEQPAARQPAAARARGGAGRPPAGEGSQGGRDKGEEEGKRK